MQRGLRQKLLETYPGFEPYIEEIMPKKASLEAVKLYVQPYNPTSIFLIKRKALKRPRTT